MSQTVRRRRNRLRGEAEETSHRFSVGQKPRLDFTHRDPEGQFRLQSRQNCTNELRRAIGVSVQIPQDEEVAMPSRVIVTGMAPWIFSRAHWSKVSQLTLDSPSTR